MSAIQTPRCAALAGPYLSGKTTLLEAMLHMAGTVPRAGSVKDGNSVGDSAPEARARQMSTELTVANAEYLGDPWTFIDCPGSIEFQQERHHALMVADTVVIVAEPSPEKARILAPLFKELDDQQIPHCLFINKIDQLGEGRIRDLLAAFQDASERPLVLRQVPIRQGESVTGYVDLASERTYAYEAGQPSRLIEMPGDVQDRETEARQEMLEALADFDDTLLEQLLEDTVPATDEIYGHLTKAAQDDRIVPVFLGSALNGNGVQRLLKALRHETAGHEAAMMRNEIEEGAGTAATVFKTLHLPHTGKLSVARVWSGEIKDGMTLNGQKVSGLSTLLGHTLSKTAAAGPGAVVGLGRLEDAKTGDVLSENGEARGIWPPPALPLYAFAIEPKRREDEVKLSGALTKLVEEDPSLRIEQNQDTGELLLWGQGEVHLQVALEKLNSMFNLEVGHRRPRVPYKETIRKLISQHARHKKQSGGHGQFGDVHLDIKPLPRGSGFAFDNTISGGAVPKQYIPAVENGVKEYLGRGPLGFPVVDVAVTLTDGQYHAVDSSDQAFKTAGSLAMREGLPKCEPVLLEPIYTVTISAPAEYTSNIQGMLSSRRGQILGFAPKDGWAGWDEVSAKVPQSEMQDLVIELRSLTQGTGTFEYSFDHLQELTGRLAEEIVREANGGGAVSA